MAMTYIRPIVITDTLLTSSTVPETDETAYNAGTTYAAGAKCMVTTPNVHMVYESLAGGNVGHDPVADLAAPPNPSDPDTGTYWKIYSATNRWKAFDGVLDDQVEQADSINYVIAPGQVWDSIFLGNLDADNVNITVTDPTDGEVYNETITTLSTINVIGGLTYYCEPIIRAQEILKTDLAELGLPPYISASISITINKPGGTAKVGQIVVGLKSELGSLLRGIEVSIKDYSTKTTTVRGGKTVSRIVQGSFAKLLRCNIIIKNVIVDEITRQYIGSRATALVFIGDPAYTCMMAYGFILSFRNTHDLPAYTHGYLEIESLT